MKAIAPNGKKIIGTADIVECTALIVPGTFSMNEETGDFDFDYEGNSDIDLNSQRPRMFDLQRAFVDEDGQIWVESLITLVEETPDEAR